MLLYSIYNTLVQFTWINSLHMNIKCRKFIYIHQRNLFTYTLMLDFQSKACFPVTKRKSWNQLLKLYHTLLFGRISIHGSMFGHFRKLFLLTLRWQCDVVIIDCWEIFSLNTEHTCHVTQVRRLVVRAFACEAGRLGLILRNGIICFSYSLGIKEIKEWGKAKEKQTVNGERTYSTRYVGRCA